MKTKNLTPFLFGAKLTSRKPPQLEMTTVVRAAFRLRPNEPLKALDEALPLSQGNMSAELFRDDDTERKGECVYGGDFADYKMNAEVMLRGTCYTPGGQALKECPVRLSVGGWSKLLRVVGRRAWSDARGGAAMSEAATFKKMPLDYAHAYGGPTYAQNPIGKGYATPELPNVELPGEPARSPTDAITPASFGAINPGWPQRAKKMGRDYGPAWRAERAPFYAQDLDWTFFQAAPQDQQLPGYLRGDEEITFQNLHPKEPVFSVRLPALRVRVFVKDAAARFREVKTSLDTVFAAPDDEVLYVTWRGLDKVKEDDLSDVKWVLVASEPLADAPLPEAHYREQLEAFERDPLELEARTPARVRDAKARFEAMLAGAPMASPPDPVTGAVSGSLGGLTAENREKVLGATASAVSGSASAAKGAPGLDMAATLTKAVNDNTRHDLPRVLPLKPGYLPPVPIGDAVREIAAQTTAMREATAESARDLKELEAIEQLASRPELVQLDPSLRPGATPPNEPGPGRDLSGLDFTGRDLRGYDLTGANLEATILTGADLRGVKLTGANLKYAVLVQADLAGADLSKCDLASANLTDARARGANLAGARLDRTFLRRAELAEARFTGAEGQLTVFESNDLSGSSWSGAKLFKVLFRDAKLDGADLSNARLTRCYFLGASARKMKLVGALLDHTSFAGSDLKGAVATDVRGEGSIWLGATIDDADFAFAVLPASHFTEAHATRTRFFGANLKGARFYRANIEHADFTRANLFGADLGKAQMSNAKFTRANLYDAKLIKAAGTGCVFEGANLKRSTLEQA